MERTAAPALALLLAACGGGGTQAPPGDTGTPPGDTGAPPDDTGPGDTGAPPDDTGPADCGLVEGIDGPAEAMPGEVVVLSVIDAGSRLDYEVAWEVSEGTLSADSGTSVTWTPPADAAIYRAQTASIAAVASAQGCQDEQVGLDVTVDWPDAMRAVVVYNPEADGSADVASAYAGSRGIPEDHLCAVPSAEQTTLAGEDLEGFAGLVQDCIDAVGGHVQYLVPVWGVPYKVSGRINDIGSGSPTTVSLDALLVFGQDAAEFTDAVWNPAYQDGDSMAGDYGPYVPFGELREEIERRWGMPYYLVARIDGADAEAAMALVDRAALAQELADAGELAGTVYVDGRYGDEPPASDEMGSYESGEWNMWGTRYLFEGLGWYPVVWDGNSEEFGTEPAPTECPDALYYAGWYSYYNYNDAFAWAPGAIGGHLDSCSACSVRDGSSWAANALLEGITATFGAVNEPYVVGMPEYDQFFLYLTQGASLGEAAYEATLVGAWMMVWVGDPLYRPYAAD